MESSVGIKESPKQRKSPSSLPPLALNRQEVAGAFGDIGVLVPLAVMLIARNQLNPTVVLLIPGLLYVWSGLFYRLPIPVQPLKAMSALVIAQKLPARYMGVAGLEMGALLLLIGLTGIADWLAKFCRKFLIRGIQVGVGLILLRSAVEKMILEPISQSPDAVSMPVVLGLVIGAIVLLVVLNRSERFPAGLALVVFGIGAGLLMSGLPKLGWGPIMPTFALPRADELWFAFYSLVIPQLPLTFANSLVAVQDVAQVYFGPQSRRVTLRALATDLGIANLAAGITMGMPVCHGCGGLTAHVKFGARTGGACLIIGSLLCLIAVLLAPSAEAICSVIPLPVMGVMLGYVGIAHCLLAKDLRAKELAVALAMGIAGGATGNLAISLAIGIAASFLMRK